MAGSPLDNWLKQHAAGEKSLSRVLRKFFDDQAARFIKAWEDDTDAESASDIWTPADWKAETTKLLAAVEDQILGMMATGAENVLNQKPKEAKAFSFGDFDLPKRVKDAIQASFTELEKQPYWQAIQSTTSDRITGILEATIEEGLSIPAISKKLRTALNGMGKVRATAIARTETTLAYNSGHDVSYRELAAEGFLEKKEWLAVVDQDTRETHEELNGAQVAADEDFDVGGSTAPFPGHWSLPAEERVNCRCTTAGVFN